MTRLYFTLEVIFAMATLAISDMPLAAQQVPSSGTPVPMVVTVEAHHGTNIPVINREDVAVYEGHDREQLTDWLPLQGDDAWLDLLLLIDYPATNSLNSHSQ